MTLPAAAGTLSDPPVLSCYLAEFSGGPYLLVATDTFFGDACGLRTEPTGVLAAVMVGAPAFWFYVIAVVY